MRNNKKIVCLVLSLALLISSGLSLTVSASEMKDADRYEAEGKSKLILDTW